VEVDHDVGGAFGVDLGEVLGPGEGAVLAPVRGPVGAARSRGYRPLPQEHDQLPRAQELRMLEEAAVHQDQVVAGLGAVARSWRAWSSRMEEAAGVQGHAAAAAATVGERATDVVGERPGRGTSEAVDRDMDWRSPIQGGDRVGECLHDLGAPDHSLGFDRRVHPSSLRTLHRRGIVTGGTAWMMRAALRIAVAASRASIACGSCIAC